jgi:hypothetical protein
MAIIDHIAKNANTLEPDSANEVCSCAKIPHSKGKAHDEDDI